MKKPLHIPLQSAVAIASERRAVGGMLTARHALFCINFLKIHDFQQVGKKWPWKICAKCPNFAINCHWLPARKRLLMPISMKLPQETSRFRATPYIAFRGKRGNNFVWHHSRMMRKRGKNRVWWVWNVKNELIIKESLCFIWSLKEFYVSLHRE